MLQQPQISDFKYFTKGCEKDEYVIKPIDVVYTWVNGSDERLMKKLNYHKMNLYLSNYLDSPIDRKIYSCPYEHCVSDNLVFVTSDKALSHVELCQNSISRYINKSLNYSVELITLFKVKSSFVSRKSGVVYRTSQDIMELFKTSSELRISIDDCENGHNFSLSQVYLATSSTYQPLGILSNSSWFVTELAQIKDAHGELLAQRNIRANLSQFNITLTKSSSTSYLIQPDNADEAINLQQILAKSITHYLPAYYILDLELASITRDITTSRYQDNDELKYSLRSLDKFMRFYRKIFIVTDNQIPDWLDVSHSKIKVVDHKEIFANLSHLPSFNSASIESNLHRIPGLSSHFLYLNDDVMLGREIFPADFYTKDYGYKIFMGWEIPNCRDSCPNAWLGDKYCDADCNYLECDWDAGDCDKNKQKFLNNHIPKIEDYAQHLFDDSCHTSCNNQWLGDRYCDSACNVLSCGFDMGDCGDKNFQNNSAINIAEIDNFTLNQIPVNFNTSLVVLKMAKYLKSITDFHSITKIEIEDMKEILVSIFSLKYQYLLVLFRSNNSHECSGKSHMIPCYSQLDKPISIRVEYFSLHQLTNTSQFQMTMILIPSNQSLYINSKLNNQQMNSSTILSSSTFVSFPQRTLHPMKLEFDLTSHKKNPNNLTIDQLDSIYPMEMSKIRLLFYDGLISKEGFNHLVARLLSKSLATNVTYIPVIMTAIPRINLEEMDWGFHWLPWEHSRQFTSTSTSSYVTGRMLKDLFADSLKYSNRILNSAYSTKDGPVRIQRNVPAHGPHFISKDILTEANRKFQSEWSATSSHRFRSSHDIQFAFTYYQFLMSENMTHRPLYEQLKALDTDQSESLNSNELRSFAVLLNTNETLSDEFLESILKKIRDNCHINRTEPLKIPLEELIRCYNWTNSTLIQSQTPRYRFEAIDNPDVEFIIINQYRASVLKKLDNLRKKSRKFICLNDNLSDIKDMKLAQVIREDVRQFLEFMLPIPSQFEKNNHFIRSRKSSTQYPLIQIGFLIVLVVVFVKVIHQFVRIYNLRFRPICTLNFLPR